MIAARTTVPVTDKEEFERASNWMVGEPITARG
jgi:hypothetical protein